jgi:hypothetical protein
MMSARIPQVLQAVEHAPQYITREFKMIRHRIRNVTSQQSKQMCARKYRAEVGLVLNVKHAQ